ncbi:MAG TPA: AmmeMemoRadiSam system protein B [Candidatus Hydrothermia bacterium]|nr:AmmeMemoRadiSam system protein B [Candidatus Hydrothermia bacterium]MDD5572530.1 AmmeMemoRadiSam system protein B [Candidatus Hydrothermia bacterium]HOP32325.1 AmmeMemoRadiSam system protein B [Candidatus Hydrothermia bacterium]
MIRYPHHAGTFYPEAREEILLLFEKFEAKKVVVEEKLQPLGAVVPHAGYIFSGPTAYACYSQIFSSKKYQNALVLGPSHYVYFKGIALWPHGKWVTPLGEIRINESFANALIGKGPFIDAPDLHEREHSIEVQIPYLQFLNPEIKIIPCLVGDLSFSMITETARILAEVVGENDVIMIASSDLYHGYSHKECIETDQKTIKGILSLDGKSFYESASRGEVMACGETGITILLEAIKKLGKNTKGYLVHYTNSADITGSRSGYVVGYASVLIGEKQ